MLPDVVLVAVVLVGLALLFLFAALDDPYAHLQEKQKKAREDDAVFRARVEHHATAWLRAEDRFIKREGRVPTTEELIAERAEEWLDISLDRV